MRLTLDTNILVYAVDIAAGERHQRAAEILDRAVEADCVLTLQSFAEFYSATTRKRKLSAERAASFIQAWRDAFETQMADQAVLADAIDAHRAHSLSFWDALLWSTARRAGCRLLVSEDLQAGRELGGVMFVDPFRREFDGIIEGALG